VLAPDDLKATYKFAVTYSIKDYTNSLKAGNIGEFPPRAPWTRRAASSRLLVLLQCQVKAESSAVKRDRTFQTEADETG